MQHVARRLNELPDTAQASALVSQLAHRVCRVPQPQTNAPLALYGAGNLGKMAQEYFKAIGHDPVPVFERDQDTDKNACVAVSVVTAPYVPIEHALLERGYRDVIPFYDLTENFRHLHPLSNGWFAPDLTKEDRTGIARVMEGWHDGVSRAHHLQFLAWRKIREEWMFEGAPLPNCERFFIPEITSVLHDHECFVDGGAHYGSVTMAFIMNVKDRFASIVAIEPDNDNLQVYQRRFGRDPRITTHSCALSEHEGIVNFHAGLGYASQISDTGHNYAITYPLDALKLKPTFIKLHLEGHELPALRGAYRTILAHRPIIAVTVYHNEDGMWRTADRLMQRLIDYRYLFRLHSWCGTGAVLYAIPNERQ